MMTRSHLVAAFVMIISLALVSCQGGVDEGMARVCFNPHCIDAEVRDTPQERAVGLMGREGLTDDEGMIFVFGTPGRYSFWMKNMKIPIDMMWVDGGGRIVHIERSVPPCESDPCASYDPGRDALYVVETAAGFSDRWGVEAGQEIVIEIG